MLKLANLFGNKIRNQKLGVFPFLEKVIKITTLRKGLQNLT